MVIVEVGKQEKLHEEVPPKVLPQADGTIEYVTLKIKRTYSKRLVNSAIVSTNANVELEEAEDVFILKAPYIKVKRSDIEAVMGSISDTKWRMIFMNRVGEVREFTNYEFIMGIPQPSQTEVDRREWTQMNVRLPKDLKEEMEILRAPDILAMNQNEFVSEAITEYIAMIKRERM